MKKQDLILIGAILATALAVLLAVFVLAEDGSEVSVRLGGEEIARYSLSVDATYELCGGTNILVIEGGEAYLSGATCPDLLCVKRGRISKVGESIVCLPNRITVTVVGSDVGDVDIRN